MIFALLKQGKLKGYRCGRSMCAGGADSAENDDNNTEDNYILGVVFSSAVQTGDSISAITSALLLSASEIMWEYISVVVLT